MLRTNPHGRLVLFFWCGWNYLHTGSFKVVGTQGTFFTPSMTKEALGVPWAISDHMAYLVAVKTASLLVLAA